MAMKFCMTPGSCSTGIHILLETLALPFEAPVLNLPAGQHRDPAYLAVNPKGTMPALALDDGSVMMNKRQPWTPRCTTSSLTRAPSLLVRQAPSRAQPGWPASAGPAPSS